MLGSFDATATLKWEIAEWWQEKIWCTCFMQSWIYSMYSYQLITMDTQCIIDLVNLYFLSNIWCSKFCVEVNSRLSMSNPYPYHLVINVNLTTIQLLSSELQQTFSSPKRSLRQSLQSDIFFHIKSWNMCQMFSSRKDSIPPPSAKCSKHFGISLIS